MEYLCGETEGFRARAIENSVNGKLRQRAQWKTLSIGDKRSHSTQLDTLLSSETTHCSETRPHTALQQRPHTAARHDHTLQRDTLQRRDTALQLNCVQFSHSTLTPNSALDSTLHTVRHSLTNCTLARLRTILSPNSALDSKLRTALRALHCSILLHTRFVYLFADLLPHLPLTSTYLTTLPLCLLALPYYALLSLSTLLYPSD